MSRRHLFRLETRGQPLLPPRAFAGRLMRSFAAASAFVGASLVAGMAGYH